MSRFGLLFGLAVTVGCIGPSGRPVEMTLPKSYTGPIWIVLDPEAPSLPVVGGRFQVVIPADGVVRVSSLDPFEQWHTFAARYDDGLLVRYLTDGQPLGPEEVALRAGGNCVSHRGGREYRYIEFYVGTKADASGFFQSEHGIPGFMPK